MQGRSAFLLGSVLTAAWLAAGPPLQANELQTYLEHAFARCPDGKIDIEQEANGPRGFVSYKVRLSSPAKECGRETHALVSQSSKQLLFADVFALPKDSRPLEVRLADLAQRLLNKPARISLGATPLEDGLREVSFKTEGKVGPFNLGGYADASGAYLLVGRRGHLNVDPRKSLLAALPANAAVRRGKRDAAINIVEISDLQCPTCKEAHDRLHELIEKNLGHVSYSRIDLPIFDVHDWSLSAALAARAIERVSPQHYWQFVDYMFQNQTVIKRDILDTFVHDFVDGHGIDRAKFDAIYRSPEERSALIHQIERLFDISVATTPTFLVNGQEIFYGYEGNYLKGYLENLLNRVK